MHTCVCVCVCVCVHVCTCVLTAIYSTLSKFGGVVLTIESSHLSVRVCDILDAPANGGLMYSSTYPLRAHGTTVTYSCNEGFDLVGDRVRECQINASWTGSEPQCQSKF